MTRWLWTAADGSVTDLSAWSIGNHVTADRDGILAPAYDVATQELAGLDGASVQTITAQAGAPTLGIDMTASDPLELRARVRALAHALRPRAGIGTLTAIGDDGAIRTLPCYYRKGLEAGVFARNRFRAVVEFFAPSPWWRGDPLRHTWSLAAPSTFFPILPLRLSPSTIAGSVTFDLSDTDAPTYPQWLVTGPGSQLTLRNETTDADLVLNEPLGDGQIAVIDTRPGQQSVLLAHRADPPPPVELARNLVTNPRGVTANTTVVERRRNRALNPRAVSTANYTGVVGATVATAADGPTLPDGRTLTTCVEVTLNGGGGGVIIGRDNSTLTTGQKRAYSVWVKTALTNASISVQGASSATSAAHPGGNTWQRLGVVGTNTSTGGSTMHVLAGAASGTFRVAAALIEDGDTVGDYFDGAATDSETIDYQWTGTADASASVAYSAYVEVVRNRFANPVPANGNGWASNDGVSYPATYSATGWADGTPCFTTTRGSANPGTAAASIYGNGYAASLYALKVTPGEQLAGSVEVLTGAANRTALVYLVFRTAAGATINVGGTSQLGRVDFPLTAGQPQRLATSAVTVPTDADSVLIIATVTAPTGTTVPTGEVTRWRRAHIGAPGVDYFDGATTDAAPYVYEWTGPANASASVRRSREPAGIGHPNGAGYEVVTQHPDGILVDALQAYGGLHFPATIGQTVTILATVTAVDALDLRVVHGSIYSPQTLLAAGETRTLRYTATVTTYPWASLTSMSSGRRRFRVLGFAVVAGTYTGPYFDGDTADDDNHAYEWTGAAHASASTQIERPPLGELIIDGSLFGSLASDPAMWPLVDGVNTVTALLTNAGSGSRIEVTADRLYSGAL